jgi:hypothetical protein
MRQADLILHIAPVVAALTGRDDWAHFSTGQEFQQRLVKYETVAETKTAPALRDWRDVWRADYRRIPGGR